MKKESADFWTPDLSILAEAMQQGLQSNYAHVDVSVVDCPDLLAHGVACSGMSGSAALFAYANLMVPLGFIPSSIILIAALSYFYGIRSIVLIILIATGVPTSIYLIFTRGLKVFLPEIPWL